MAQDQKDDKGLIGIVYSQRRKLKIMDYLESLRFVALHRMTPETTPVSLPTPFQTGLKFMLCTVWQTWFHQFECRYSLSIPIMCYMLQTYPIFTFYRWKTRQCDWRSLGSKNWRLSCQKTRFRSHIRCNIHWSHSKALLNFCRDFIYINIVS